MRNLFRLKKENKEIKDRRIIDIQNLFKHAYIRNIFRFKKSNKVIKDRILRDITNPFEQEEENYYKPERVSNFWSNNYIEYKSKGDRSKKLSVKEYLNKIRPYLKDIINHLKISDTWKIHLIIANNFICM